VLVLVVSGSARAQQQGILAERSLILGGRIASASVTLLRDGQSAGSDDQQAGEFTLTGLAEGRFIR
jgi:hypothetical protein